MTKAQGQNHDIIATLSGGQGGVALSHYHKSEALMKRYFVLNVQDLSQKLLCGTLHWGVHPQNSKQKSEIRIDNQLVRLGEEERTIVSKDCLLGHPGFSSNSKLQVMWKRWSKTCSLMPLPWSSAGTKQSLAEED